MSFEAVKKHRTTLQTKPSGRFTADRKTALEIENVGLRMHYSDWLTRMTGHKVSEETFCEDLLSGEALCKIMSKIEGSGVSKYHIIAKSPAHLKKFHQKDNMVKFQDACRRLGLPDTVTTGEIEAGDSSKVISVLVHIEEICDEDGIEPELLEQPEAEPSSSSKRRSKRSSSKRKKNKGNALMDFIEQIKELCGCGKKTVKD